MDGLNIAVVGGSISGLTVASSLRDGGNDVSVFERSRSALDDRGAGLAMDPAIARLFGPDFGMSVEKRVILDRTGREVWSHPTIKCTASWSSVYHAVSEATPESLIHRGTPIADVGTQATEAWVATADGERRSFDLVVGADGIGSTVRHVVDPDFKPEYLGYVAYRGLLPVVDLPAQSTSTLEILAGGSMLNLYLDGSHLVAYIVGLGQDYKEQYVNWMWYRNVPPPSLREVLTDRKGGEHEWSLAPSMMPEDREAKIREDAAVSMDPSMAAIVQATKGLSIQTIYHGHASTFHSGRLALIGDAARIAIPHIGAGTSMAIADARSLADAVASADDDASLEECLESWSVARRASTLGTVEYARDLGLAIQFSDNDWTTWTPEDFETWWASVRGDHHVYFEPTES